MMVDWWWIPVSWMIGWCVVINIAALVFIFMGWRRNKRERQAAAAKIFKPAVVNNTVAKDKD